MAPEERERIKQLVSDAVRAREQERDRRNGASKMDSAHPAVTLNLLCALSHLNPDQREAWVDRRIVGRSLERIGRDMKSTAHPKGLTRERVRQLEQEAQRRLADYVETSERYALLRRDRARGLG